MKLRFIVNPISGGSSKKAIIKAIDELIDHDRYDCQVWPTRYAGHGAVLATMAAENGIDIVVAIGGDGTINEVARSLVHTDTILGIVPCGSGNGLARHLQIPLDYRKALRMINDRAADSVAIDYGLINGRPFFCTCGMGFDATVSYRFSASTKRGLRTYIENTITALAKYKPEKYELITDPPPAPPSMEGSSPPRGGAERGSVVSAFTLAIANASQYGNNAYIAPYASMADGLMDITIIEPFPMTEAPAMAYRLFSGKFEDGTKHIRMFQTSHLRIVRERDGVIHCDGDPMKAPREIDVRIVPGALRVICQSDAGAHTQPLYQTLGQTISQPLVSLSQPLASVGQSLGQQASQIISDMLRRKK